MTPPLPNRAPPHWRAHVYERSFDTARPRAAVWAWLNEPATFVDTQVPPYRVEFLDDTSERGGMTPGTYNVHHGPLLLFAGVVGDRADPDPDDPSRPAVRDLHYGYGSHAISMRLIRPTLLRFTAEHLSPSDTRLTLRVESLTHPRVAGLWTAVQRPFWSMFPRWLERSVPTG